jgi:hypothetical protein
VAVGAVRLIVLGGSALQSLEPGLEIGVPRQGGQELQDPPEAAGQLGVDHAALGLAVQRDGFTANRRDGLQRPG